MKKNFTLALALFTLLNTVAAQTKTCTTENFSTQTVGWTYSQGASEGEYLNPVNNCTADRGIITPGVGGNNPCNIKTANFISNGSPVIDLTFNMLVFNANLKCESWKDFPCLTSVDAFFYVGNTKYTGMIDALLPPNGPGHSTLIHLSFSAGNYLPAGTAYKVELCFKPKSGLGSAVQQNTKYVFDNLTNCQGVIAISPEERNAHGTKDQPKVSTLGEINSTKIGVINTTMYPNPSNGSSAIIVNTAAGAKNIQLFDNNGKKIPVIQGKTGNIETKGLKNGVYFVLITMNSGEQETKKLIIN
ncbi:MAG: T9SS type A sorting domain-containing protein [Ferruginibacter sp.]